MLECVLNIDCNGLAEQNQNEWCNREEDEDDNPHWLNDFFLTMSYKLQRIVDINDGPASKRKKRKYKNMLM